MKIGGQIPWNVIPICETFKMIAFDRLMSLKHSPQQTDYIVCCDVSSVFHVPSKTGFIQENFI